MNAKQRDSFETLDLADLRDATEEESGLRRLPAGPPPLPRRDAMPSLWREVVEGAPAEDPDPTYVSVLPPSPEVALERVDLDALVDELATASDALSAPRPASLAAPLVVRPERRAPRLLPAAVVATVLAAYFAGVATAGSWEAPASSAPIEKPRPSASAQPELEHDATTTLAPIVFAPSPVTSAPLPRSPRVEAPTGDRAARRAAPSRAEVHAALARVAPRVEACASDADTGRVARVRVTFGSHGRAVHALATGVSGPSASCIAAAARRARVAPFARESFAVEYPFAL